ncbi:MAG: hypothetical protein H6R10_1524 [Rhodocyclaceae bacterium]|nr:hypothetical protein [Rhodocyclaceae bacterium]
MKETVPSLIRKLWMSLRGAWLKPNQASIYQEMEQGALFGFFACSGFTLWLAGSQVSAALLILFSGLGLLLGAVFGAVLWIGSAELPEDTVAAPPPEQDRSKRDRPR